MQLIPATLDLIRAEIEDRPAFARLLSAVVPENWPPETLVDALPWFLHQMEATPHQSGWFGWYGLAVTSPDRRSELVASGGFKGPPQNGTAEVGYSVLPQHQGQGFATEMVGALVAWAFRQPGLQRIIAETTEGNLASICVLNKLGFRSTGAGNEPGSIGFELLGQIMHIGLYRRKGPQGGDLFPLGKSGLLVERLDKGGEPHGTVTEETPE
jgi:RimJ/RimL family protein N-acetyltransferase